MSDIFISYANEDRARVQKLATALASRGWSVWWDRQIPAGKTFDQVITKALADARCVIVVWSNDSVNSNWVREEAEKGLEREMLVPILFDKISPPMGFGRIQAADLTDWQGAASSQAFQNLTEDIASVLDSPSVTDKLATSSDQYRDTTIRSQPNVFRNNKMAFYSGGVLLLIAGLIFGFNYFGKSEPEPIVIKTNPEPGVVKTDHKDAGNKPISHSQDGNITQKSDNDMQPNSKHINLLLAENDGQVLAATSDQWLKTIDGNERDFAFYESNLGAKTEAVYAFKDERPAEFNMFTVLIQETKDSNLKDFELLWGDESVTGKFHSIGKFQTKNIKLMKTPYQEFKFSPITAKYLKVRLLSTWVYALIDAREFQLWGTLQ